MLWEIENIGPKAFLEILEISDNKIEKIENLEGLPSLRHLFINKNRISKIENLEPVAHITLLGLTVGVVADCRRTKSQRSRTWSVSRT